MSDSIRVAFLPDGVDAWVAPGTTLLAAAASAHVAIDAPCGDRGICGKCKVQAEGRLNAPNLAEMSLLTADEIDQGWRLACQATALGSVEVTVPERAIRPAIVPLTQVEPKPAVRKLSVSVPEPSLEDPTADLARLKRAMGPGARLLEVGLPVIHTMPAVIRESGSDLTAVVAHGRLLALEPGDTRKRSYGIAVDLGTTSVVVALVDLTDGTVLGIESRLNGQANQGADVISRITYATTQPGGIAKLQAAAVNTIADCIHTLSRKHEVPLTSIYEMVVVGNTCMNHLFLGIDPASLAQAPYHPAIVDPVVAMASELGFRDLPSTAVYTLPNVAGFVGSDTVAVVLATALHESPDLKLAIDLGTNGEMVLGHRGKLLTCSTAAGPAFEGARISCGMRATRGAIERVWINQGEVKIQVIGGDGPIGLCGSGLLDAVAQMVQAGILNRSGRMVSPDTEGLNDAIAGRFTQENGTSGFTLGHRGKRKVDLTQGDVRELQLGKGAIRAGVSILLKEFGATEDDISEVLLAGAFGSYVSPSSAREIGLVPNLPLDRITSVGNAAGQGAIMSLISQDLRAQALDIARSAHYIELSSRADFMEEFTDALFLGSGSF